jgi:hypothetical protein
MTAFVTIPAVASPLPGFQIIGQSEHFAFYARHGRKTETKANERFLTKTALLMGQSAEGQTAYYLHDDAQEVGAATGVYSSGMTELTSGEIHSTQAFHPHEIVHRIAAELGDPGPFFHEGLAVSLGDEGKQGGVSVDVLARAAVQRYRVRDVVDGFTRVEPHAAYSMAGSFVGYLIRRHGVATVARFFRGCRPQVVVRDRRFRDVFGLRIDEAAAAWKQEISGAPMTTDRVSVNRLP